MARGRQWGEDSTVCIKLSSGGSITLQFKGNLFDLSDDEHKLIGDLRAILQKYREASERVPAAELVQQS
jgi:hypothetical protein